MAPRKRSAAALASDRRRSGRLANTPKKSSYFDDVEADEGDGTPPRKKRGRPSKRSKRLSPDTEDSAEKYQEGSDGDTVDNAIAADDDDDDAPRKVEIIPLIKLRDTEGVEYEGRKIHKNTTLFLKDLKANNKRSWLKANDDEYRRALKDWQSFIETTTQTIISIDETVPDLPVKDVIFRIHRDIRFSKDPTPYKPHFSAAWSRTGRKGPYACYYLHCEPGSSFIGGGLWHPEPQHVHKLRRSIDQHPTRWRRALNAEPFKRVFFPTVKPSAGHEAVVKAFVQRNQENALKKKPMGYDVTHPDIELLKLRNFTIGTSINVDMLCKNDAQEKVGDVVGALSSFVTFLNSIVMPDPNLDVEGSSDEEDEDDNS